MTHSPIESWLTDGHTILCICEDLSEHTVRFAELLRSRLSDGDKLYMVVQDNRARTDEIGYRYTEPHDIEVWRTVPEWLEQEDHDTVSSALALCVFGPQDLRGGDLTALDGVKEILIYNQH